jgi:hypothetical protein
MRTLVVILLILGLGYGGYLFWQQTQVVSETSYPQQETKFATPSLSLQSENSVLASIESVLGESISSGVATVTDSLNTLTHGASEPIINNAISSFQKELSKLPEDQVKKIQYNYCKSIVEEYEKQP